MKKPEIDDEILTFHFHGVLRDELQVVQNFPGGRWTPFRTFHPGEHIELSQKGEPRRFRFRWSEPRGQNLSARSRAEQNQV